MDPFLMTCVSDSDLWMFLSSRGTFTAGRVEADRCIFSYETDDRLHDQSGITGPVTRIRFPDGRVWSPIGTRRSGHGPRTLRRSVIGDYVEFEETDDQSGLTLRVEYALSSTFGVIRSCELRSDAAGLVTCELIDGYLKIMPAGVPLSLQQTMSTLVDGYKRSEFAYEGGPAVYVLESAITDRPEAVESLRANVVWRTGLSDASVSLSEQSLRAFEQGEAPVEEVRIFGRPGAYLCRASVEIAPGDTVRWRLVADADLDQTAISEIHRTLQADSATVDERIEESLARGRLRLARLLDAADGAQVTRDACACAAHRSNVLFNAMRGGVPIDGYSVDPVDFCEFARRRNAVIAARHESFLSRLAPPLSTASLIERTHATDDPQLSRLAYEFLPLNFSRRHGDPSRPWNRFRIRTTDGEGRPIIGYEGNWRDIFQNWEALCHSYPALLPNVIAKFVNASTLDGHNPYRISDQGVDWEVPDPDHAWAAFGYWGDHQIIYLLRLLELSHHTLPDWLPSVLEEPLFSYSNVPYRLRSFDEIVRNPRATIDFDTAAQRLIDERVETIGDDGRLVWGSDNEPLLVTLMEKLLVPALAKVSNLAPGGGIWMNTQRPEWNDANNALAGFGLSMVTLYHLRRYCDFIVNLLEGHDAEAFSVSESIRDWCRDADAAIEQILNDLPASGIVEDTARWRALAALGGAADAARRKLYTHGAGARRALDRATVIRFFLNARRLCDHSIARSRRSDGLYESYNILEFGSSTASVTPLDVMLEGQVAILSSGALGPNETLAVLEALFESDLYRADQRSFTLYPKKSLPPFMGRNVVSPELIQKSQLLQAALEHPELGLVVFDAEGRARFHADLVSHHAVDERLAELAESTEWGALVRDDAPAIHEAYEATFRHAQFTGRSGRMHKYEGLGSIYWHMVSKLWLEAQESILRFRDAGADPALLQRLVSHCRRIRDGLGFRKSPGEFGATPFDPYSHTPASDGAQQPGMTGQVKEGIIARLGELGVRVLDGRLHFHSELIGSSEFLEELGELRLSDGPDGSLPVPPNAVGYTFCGVPIILNRSDENLLVIRIRDGSTREFPGGSLPEEWTRHILLRTGHIRSIEAQVSRAFSPTNPHAT
ncbi:MAG: hypothetical protein ACF8PN_04055 [Phycisphaerales bacterium]